jgi:hypothetical protein
MFGLRLAGRRVAVALALVAALAGTGAGPATPAKAVTGDIRVTLIRITYGDAATHLWSVLDLESAGGEMQDFYRRLSDDQLRVGVSVTSATLTGTRASYWTDCRPDHVEQLLPCADVFGDAITAAAVNAGYDFRFTNAVLLLSPSCPGGVAYVPRALPVSDRHVVQQAYVNECPAPAGAQTPGASRVFWNGWAHEVGHMLESIEGIPTFSGRWLGHPSSYASGYDFMDSCYPCSESSYGLSGPDTVSLRAPRKVFPNWLDPARIVTVDAPRSGTIERSAVLRPLTRRNDGPGTLAFKLPEGGGRYYLVEARRRGLPPDPDGLDVKPGIYDSGVKIQFVDEWADPPVRPMNACDTTYAPAGCVRTRDIGVDARAADCWPYRPPYGSAAAAVPMSEYCWPYALWHPGNTFARDGIEVVVGDPRPDGYLVSVRRSARTPRPDLFLRGLEHCLVRGNGPWCADPRALPFRVWQSPDIWVDSVANGYASDVGPSGLRSGIGDGGTPVGNGDDIVAGYENRIYARVSNRGDAAASDVRVHFWTPEQPSLRIAGDAAWKLLGNAGPEQFPQLSALGQGESADVFVPWTPPAGADPFVRTSVRVTIDPAKGETELSDQDGRDQRESFATVESVRAPDGAWQPASAGLVVDDSFPPENRAKDPMRTFALATQADKGAAVTVAGGKGTMDVGRGASADTSIQVVPAAGTPVGARVPMTVEAFTIASLYNELVPEDSGTGASHPGVAGDGVSLVALTVEPSLLVISALPGARSISAVGLLAGVAGARIAIAYTSPDGKPTTHLVTTDAAGGFADSLPATGGTWTVRAMYVGSGGHASAASPAAAVTPL